FRRHTPAALDAWPGRMARARAGGEPLRCLLSTLLDAATRANHTFAIVTDEALLAWCVVFPVTVGFGVVRFRHAVLFLYGARSAGTRLYNTASRLWPCMKIRLRETPSRWAPAFSATRWLARLSTLMTISKRAKLVCSKAKRAISRTAAVATPFPVRLLRTQ